MGHQLTVEQAEDYSFSHEIAGSYGKGDHKSLKTVVQNTKVWFEVYHHNKTVMAGPKLSEAVAVYNAL